MTVRRRRRRQQQLQRGADALPPGPLLGELPLQHLGTVVHGAQLRAVAGEQRGQLRLGALPGPPLLAQLPLQVLRGHPPGKQNHRVQGV